MIISGLLFAAGCGVVIFSLANMYSTGKYALCALSALTGVAIVLGAFLTL